MCGRVAELSHARMWGKGFMGRLGSRSGGMINGLTGKELGHDQHPMAEERASGRGWGCDTSGSEAAGDLGKVNLL